MKIANKNSGYRQAVSALLIVAGLWATGIYTSGAEPGHKEERRAKIGPAAAKTAYLTIDDGPDASRTPRVLDVLKRYKVRATFFVVGYQARLHPEIVLLTYYSGHQIGNHTFSHNYAELYRSPSPEPYLLSIKENEEIINGIIAVKPRITRPPGGAAGNFGAAFIPALKAGGYRTVAWNVDAGDTDRGATTESVINNVKGQVAALPPGTPPVILLHDTHDQTVEALPGIIDFLKSQGYRFDAVTKKRPPDLANVIY